MVVVGIALGEMAVVWEMFKFGVSYPLDGVSFFPSPVF